MDRKELEQDLTAMIDNAKIIAASQERRSLIEFVTAGADRFGAMSGRQVAMEVLGWVRSRHSADVGALPGSTHDGNTEPMELDDGHDIAAIREADRDVPAGHKTKELPTLEALRQRGAL